MPGKHPRAQHDLPLYAPIHDGSIIYAKPFATPLCTCEVPVGHIIGIICEPGMGCMPGMGMPCTCAPGGGMV